MIVTVVSQLLQRHRLGSRKACKTLPLGHHVNRDRQFQIIANHRTAFMHSPNPIVSMDTKHKEFFGLLSGRAGSTRKRPRRPWTMIFPAPHSA